MLKQGAISQVRDQSLLKADATIIVTMRTYPRGLKKDLMSEYLSVLAPDAALFKDFKALQGQVGHNEAFIQCDYEDRFQITPLAYEHLRRLSKLSQNQNVYLVCQCELGLRCHRELLLMIAHHQFEAEIAPLSNAYLSFEKRLPEKSFLTRQSFW